MTKSVFLQHLAGDPFFNMAVDEWLLWRVSSEPDLVYVRLYTWQTGAITFGLNQKKELALDFAKVADTPVIRRITGGRAVYHDPAELTYAIAVNTHHLDNRRLVGSLVTTSASIAEALTRFLGRLGIPSHYLRRDFNKNFGNAFFHTAACFDSVARHEVVANSRKIVASAQRRIGSAFLQHGSIKLHGIVPHPALAGRSPQASSASVVQSITGEELSSTASLFVEEMEQQFGLAFEENNLTPGENSEVTKRAVFVKKNPLSKRDIFERCPPETSLLEREEKTF